TFDWTQMPFVHFSMHLVQICTLHANFIKLNHTSKLLKVISTLKFIIFAHHLSTGALPRLAKSLTSLCETLRVISITSYTFWVILSYKRLRIKSTAPQSGF